MKEFRKTQINEKVEQFNIGNMYRLPKVMYRFNANPYQNHNGIYFAEIEKKF